VATTYGSKSISEVQQDMANYVTWYGVDGFFFDEMMNTCSFLTYYTRLRNKTRSTIPGGLVISNPGSGVPQCLAGTADVIVTFEGSRQTYLGGTYAPDTWTLSGTNLPQFWHIIYNVAANQLSAVVAQSKRWNSAVLCVTDGVMPNPYSALPPVSYWSALRALANASSI
jgi:hypothetical protein